MGLRSNTFKDMAAGISHRYRTCAILKKFLIRYNLVVGSILVCLFPLWPPEVRNGVYYLSMSAMVFVGVIVALIVRKWPIAHCLLLASFLSEDVSVRSILFGLVWMTTMGRHHFWLLPNLTEDCGFFDSFKPTYSHKYYPKAGSDDSKDEKSDSIAIQDVKEDNNEENLKSEDNLESKTNEDGEDLSGEPSYCLGHLQSISRLHCCSDKSDKTDTDRESDEERGDCKDDEPKTKRRGKDSRSSSSHESNNDFELVDTPAANNQ